jgi:hypothetical protein
MNSLSLTDVGLETAYAPQESEENKNPAVTWAGFFVTTAHEDFRQT